MSVLRPCYHKCDLRKDMNSEILSFLGLTTEYLVHSNKFKDLFEKLVQFHHNTFCLCQPAVHWCFSHALFDTRKQISLIWKNSGRDFRLAEFM